MPRKRRLEDFTSAALKRAAPAMVAVLPVAAVEQHGPHLPLGTDLHITNGLLDMALEALDERVECAALPAIAYGKSDEHQGFAGTLTLSAEVLTRTLCEIGASLARSGVRRLVILSGHGGNSECMGIAGRALRREHSMAVVATNFMRLGVPRGIAEDELRFGIHGGLVETSLMLHLRPELVDMASAGDFASRAADLAERNEILGFSGPGALSWMTGDLNDCGAVGDAASATAALGKRIARHQSQRLATLIAELAAFDPNSLTG